MPGCMLDRTGEEGNKVVWCLRQALRSIGHRLGSVGSKTA
jgi:hypothetical protein